MNASPASANRTPAWSAPTPRTRPAHWILLILGVLLAALGTGLTVGGAMLLGADIAQRDGGYLMRETQRAESPGNALRSGSAVIDLRDTGLSSATTLGDLASVLVRVTPIVPDQDVFVGIGPKAAVTAYLEGVSVTALDGPRLSQKALRSDVTDRTTTGTRTPAAPATQDFWAVSASGAGSREITFDLEAGAWSLVVMNADASRPVWVDLDVGVRSTLIGPVGTGVLVSGLVALVMGLPLLLWGAARLGRDIDPRGAGTDPGSPGSGPYDVRARDRLAVGAAGPVSPVRLTGYRDEGVSRALWLVKWALVIPHYLVLSLLWFALVVTTIAAGIAILFTGRYPRSWFFFSVGVLRWSWRVGFYSYSALGTDRYPPFSLAPSAGYPADLDIPYPDRLSRGLVLVKGWLLAIPHLLVVGVIAGGGAASWGVGWEEGATTGARVSPSLLGILVLIAAVTLLFTGRYRDGLFDLIMGLNRWVNRVGAYVLLLRDEYPPFRLDQGPTEPSTEVDRRDRHQTPDGPDPSPTGQSPQPPDGG